jgi:hypothetical protein
MNTIIASTQDEDSEGQEFEKAWSADVYKDRRKVDPNYAARL